MFSLNCQSLQGKLNLIREDKTVIKSDVICISESWLSSDEPSEDLRLQGFDLKLNSVGQGKGLATYFRKELFKHSTDIKETFFQLSKLSSPKLDVISVYRSQAGKTDLLFEKLSKLMEFGKCTLICGDFNICFNADRRNPLIDGLENLCFQQFVKAATHFEGGLIDHVYVRQGLDQASIQCTQYSPYYCAKDHDAQLVTINL